VLRTISVTAIIMLMVACQRSPEPAATGGGRPSPPGNRSSSAQHPLDPLTADEIALAVQVAKSDPRFAAAAFPSVALEEPRKSDVLA